MCQPWWKCVSPFPLKHPAGLQSLPQILNWALKEKGWIIKPGKTTPSEQVPQSQSKNGFSRFSACYQSQRLVLDPRPLLVFLGQLPTSCLCPQDLLRPPHSALVPGQLQGWRASHLRQCQSNEMRCLALSRELPVASFISLALEVSKGDNCTSLHIPIFLGPWIRKEGTCLHFILNLE